MVVSAIAFFAVNLAFALGNFLKDEVIPAEDTFLKNQVNLALAVAAATYIPAELGVDGFIRDGHLLNNYSALRLEEGFCPPDDVRPRFSDICCPKGTTDRDQCTDAQYKTNNSYSLDVCDSNHFTGYSHEKFIVVRNDQFKVSVFAFRGLLFNSMFKTVYDENIGPKVKISLAGMEGEVCQALYNNFNEFEHEVKKQLLETPADHKVVITGHGMGAALSYIAAPHFTVWGRPSDAQIAFECPKMGDPSFSNLYQTLVGCDRTATLHVKPDFMGLIAQGFTMPCKKKGIYSRQQWWSKDAFDLYRGVYELVERLYNEGPDYNNQTCPLKSIKVIQ